ncbi:N-acetylglucosamine kinase [Culicoidibacter larvae]|uniref:ATPase BadF/BadG/BcrA/BcrD type domain-containing protein n=1 Tax=Culicoidibacter larvae TaxID=2579976 RepID=A0A5R8QA68_9FIRM|nr:BadF/BadG/BcrA/BcrD ATPase family protein [Culicoidibacter larvae]TLG72757.1 hypothetical protein FEZ08_08630 [Culicoidibacter larvae]
MRVAVGIDVGGTKTHVGIYDEQGNKLHDFVGLGTNLANDKEVAIQIVYEATGSALSALGEIEVAKIVIGMAGVLNHPLLPSLIETMEAAYRTKVAVYNDVVFAHKAIFQNQPGLLLSAGTGSIAVVRAASEYRIIGGYGHLFGDESSGYDIAKRGLMHAMHQADRGQNDVLSSALLEALGTETIRAAVPKLYKQNKAETAALAKIVAELAEQGDVVAQTILSDSADAFADQVIVALQEFGIQPQCYAFWGSVLQNNLYMQDRIRRQLEHAFTCSEVSSQHIDITQAVIFE